MLLLFLVLKALTKYSNIKNYSYYIILLSRKSLKVRKVPRHWGTKTRDCVTNQKKLREAADSSMLSLTYEPVAARCTTSDQKSPGI